MAEKSLHKAKWWKVQDNNTVLCGLCPRKCQIAKGKRGFCEVRENHEGELLATSYGYPVALQVDPIEKKPLNEFMSGTTTFSIGTFGCNLNCIFCQNHHLARGKYGSAGTSSYISPENIIKLTEQHNCKSVAFTYNEPTVFAEYAMDIAKLAKEKGLATVLVSNGYITLEAAADLYPLIDAANIDMKGFSRDFYREMCDGSFEKVLKSIKYFYSLDKHLELTNLVIPDKNDSEEMINAYLDWVAQELNLEIPLHFSAYHPDYKYHESPRTSREILHKIEDIARDRGFKHVYLGNIW